MRATVLSASDTQISDRDETAYKDLLRYRRVGFTCVSMGTHANGLVLPKSTPFSCPSIFGASLYVFGTLVVVTQHPGSQGRDSPPFGA